MLFLACILRFLYLVANKRLTATKFSMLLAHSGYAVMIVAICLNSLLQKEFNFSGTIGDQKYWDNIEIKLQNVRYQEQNNYYRHIADFWIKFPNGNEIIISPENRFYKIEKSLAAEIAIKHFYFYDIYVVLSGAKEEQIEAKFYIKPFMMLLWISCCMISLGIALGFVRKQEKLSGN